MKKRKIILAPPYSGTLYAYFNDCMSPYHHHTEMMGHPYYNKLFSVYTEQSKDIALTLSILYDEIIVPPADACFPKDGLGFSISWDKFLLYKQDRAESIKQYCNDSKLSLLLQG